MPFLPPNQQHQSTEGKHATYAKYPTYWLRNANKYLMTVRTLFGSVDSRDRTCVMLVITSAGPAEQPQTHILAHRQTNH